MTDSVRYIDAIDTMWPDGYAREALFRSSGDMLAPAPPPKGFWLRLLQSVSHWRMKRSGRLALLELSDDQLRDIGVTRIDADREARKSWMLLRP
ncbi:hypothetical protein ACO34A_12455 [Rhizobium sp. ACO-34A]|nr:DUF1127 domain-containing protein [Rhizobium sp. ACO-34A]ATN34611.1 hypothetical protein ACO34A_12455 [Rhizobium sp. ACO-34A]